MMNDAYLARLRQSRDAKSVIKIRFVTLRGRVGDTAIFVFEGDDDKIVYGRWIARLKPGLNYEIFVCGGKKRVRYLQGILNDDLGSLSNNTFLFIDRDFDDKEGFIEEDNLFMTDRYSVENYLVSRDVVWSVIRDEFPCHELLDLRESVCDQFQVDFDTFLKITREFNRRLYVARRSQIHLECGGLPKRVSEYAAVDVGQLEAANPPVENVIVFASPITPEADAMLSIQFDLLEPSFRYRGKNALLFFDRWLSRLADHFDARTGIFAGEAIGGRVRRNELTLGSYAARSTIPEELPAFLDKIAA
jgi:hypothetical protein